MGFNRKVYCGSIIALQFVVEVLLGLSGTFYIIATLQLRDLLLNCSALLIVLDLDELIFAALAPRKGWHLINSLKPLRRPKAASFKSMNCSPIVFLTAIVLIVGM